MTKEYENSLTYKFIDNDKFDLSLHDITEFLKQEFFDNPDYCYIIGTQNKLVKDLWKFIESRDITYKIEINTISCLLSLQRNAVLIDVWLSIPQICNKELSFQFMITRVGTGYLCEVYMDKQFVVFANS